ncbi:sensor histidine kinase [Zooshikella harenae]|uniref:histidine kinase n=1 Tax=Zooshikella harenae TaxID=2827238 RepID=A0ABS5Z6L7_9GAMM|nr:ATP-binding protein [Zooshikella harenae]MBU2709634.1 GHKL domain-containing protein [Zooshikella harenae]
MARTHQDNSRNWLSDPQTGAMSLKQRLILRVGLVLTITWLVEVVYSNSVVWHKTQDLIEHQTQLMAKSWITVVEQGGIDGLTLIEEPNFMLLGWLNDQLVIKQGHGDFDKPNNKKTYDTKIGQDKWIISSLCQNNACLLVGLKDTERRCTVKVLVILIFLPLLIIFILTMLAMNIAVKSGLRPLNTLAEKVSCASVDKLTPFQDESNTKELLPLIQALNQLMLNMKAQLIKERQFLDTCTHELRTPVTAFIAQIQSLHMPDKNSDSFLMNINNAALRVVRVANQFLSLAKSHNRELLKEQHERFDLCELLRQMVIELVHDHEQCDCQMQGLITLEVEADPLAMEMVIKNLIENALRYGQSTEDGKVKLILSCHRYDEMVIISIEDGGSGIDEQYRHKVLQRFYRVPGQGVEGAGLGLSIVSDVTAGYGGDVVLAKSQELGGLQVTVSLKGIAV